MAHESIEQECGAAVVKEGQEPSQFTRSVEGAGLCRQQGVDNVVHHGSQIHR